MNNNLKTSCGTFIAPGWSDLETGADQTSIEAAGNRMLRLIAVPQKRQQTTDCRSKAGARTITRIRGRNR
jgi:hypothetical protein